MATAWRVQEGYNRTTRLNGSFGRDLWRVDGIKPQIAHISSEANAAGLPKVGDLDPFTENAIVFATSVVLVINSELGKEQCVVQVDYRPLNWRVWRYLGGSLEKSEHLDWTLPVIYNLAGAPPYWVYEKVNGITSRTISYRTETRVNPGQSLDQIQVFRDNNIRKLYNFGNRIGSNVQIPYILDNIYAEADRGNNIAVTCYFRTESPMKGYAANYFGNGNLAIPALDYLESYRPIRTVDGGYSSINVVARPDQYEQGAAIPWL